MRERPGSPRTVRHQLMVVAFGVLVVGLMMAPATTRQGVNFTVTTHQLPLYLKLLSFMDRHYQYRYIAQQVTAGLSSDRERAARLLDWTRRQIHPTPPGLPVVDDHILHIIIRGYGEPDQMADVFTTLATYAGVPAFWEVVKIEEKGRLILSFAKIDGRWAVFDVARELMFTDAHGQPVDVRELALHPELTDAVVGNEAPYGIPYRRYVERLSAFQVPAVLRAEKQMPLRRIWYEVALHLRFMPAEQVSIGS